MSRGRKLLIVGVVIAIGISLAWPFRRSAVERTAQRRASLPAIETQVLSTTNGEFPAQNRLAPVELESPLVVAKMAGLSESNFSGSRALPATSFDLANHPALSATSAPREFTPASTASPVTPPVPPQEQTPLPSYAPAQVQRFELDARPAYATTDRRAVVHSRLECSAEERHVVQNSDTLEKLAKRYLGDEARALEIFDLNRDLLDNPHLLPIGAELRIPVDARSSLD